MCVHICNILLKKLCIYNWISYFDLEKEMQFNYSKRKYGPKMANYQI